MIEKLKKLKRTIHWALYIRAEKLAHFLYPERHSIGKTYIDGELYTGDDPRGALLDIADQKNRDQTD